jgi:hypothetical protein
MTGKVLTILRNEGIKGLITRAKNRRDKKFIMMKLLRELRNFSNLMLISTVFKKKISDTCPIAVIFAEWYVLQKSRN